MKKSMRIVMAVAFGAFAAVSVCAKDRPSLALEAGAVGSEKTYSQTSTISDDSISIPYTRTVFSPDVRLGIDIPIKSIRENCFFGLKFAYNLSWEKSNSNSDSITYTDTSMTHAFSIFPELVFVKNDLRFIFGTGISFGINLCKYENTYSSSGYVYQVNQEYTLYELCWTSEIAVKYCLTNHFSVLADLTISVPFGVFERNGSYLVRRGGYFITGGDYADYTYLGRFPMSFCPRVGLSYMF